MTIYESNCYYIEQEPILETSVPESRDAKHRPVGNLGAASGGLTRAEAVEGKTQAPPGAAPRDSHLDSAGPGQTPIKRRNLTR